MKLFKKKEDNIDLLKEEDKEDNVFEEKSFLNKIFSRKVLRIIILVFLVYLCIRLFWWENLLSLFN